jgi:hypothetical protein
MRSCKTCGARNHVNLYKILQNHMYNIIDINCGTKKQGWGALHFVKKIS